MHPQCSNKGVNQHAVSHKLLEYRVLEHPRALSTLIIDFAGGTRIVQQS